MLARRQFVQKLPGQKRIAATRGVQRLDHRRRGIAAFRDAPLDDEPWTAEDEAAAAEGRADLAAGRTVSLEQAIAELTE